MAANTQLSRHKGTLDNLGGCENFPKPSFFKAFEFSKSYRNMRTLKHCTVAKKIISWTLARKTAIKGKLWGAELKKAICWLVIFFRFQDTVDGPQITLPV